MVYFMENPIKMDDLGGPALFLETPISIFMKGTLLTFTLHYYSEEGQLNIMSNCSKFEFYPDLLEENSLLVAGRF